MRVEKNRSLIFKEKYIWKSSEFSSKPFNYELKSFFCIQDFFSFSIACLCMSMSKDIHSPRWKPRGLKGKNTPSETFFSVYTCMWFSHTCQFRTSSLKSTGIFLVVVPGDLRFCRPNPSSSHTSATPVVNGGIWGWGCGGNWGCNLVCSYVESCGAFILFYFFSGSLSAAKPQLDYRGAVISK